MADASTEASRAALPRTPLPWTQSVWSQLQGARQAGRLAHAILLTGPSGVGKRHLADCLARSLLCSSPAERGDACGHCPDCRLLEAGNHPDFIRVAPESDSKSGEIPVDKIRALTERESLTPSRAAWKVALIDPADKLNPAAANALLKTLEEPAGQTLLCLIGERLGSLPATVRSRCLVMKIGIPQERDALDWLDREGSRDDWQLCLRLAHGAPLRALSDFDEAFLARRRERLKGFFAIAAGEQDPLLEAVLWQELGASLTLEWLTSWICDLVRLMVSDEPVRLENPDQHRPLLSLARRIEPVRAHRYLKRVLEGRALAETNVNHQLLLESLLIDWHRISGGSTQWRP